MFGNKIENSGDMTMLETQLSREVDFVVKHRGIDETTVLAQAIREGIHKLYRDTIIESYLSGSISRKDAVKELGFETVEEIEYQRDAFARDVAWGLSNG
jgi:hypothetical protein